MTVEDDSRLEEPSKERNADRELVHEEDVEGLEVRDGLHRRRKQRGEGEEEGEGEVKLTKDGQDDVKRLKDGPGKSGSEDVGLESAWEEKKEEV